MRLWTLSPRYLDPKGLVACWREGLLAQRVLLGGTTAYQHHPQLDRFRAQTAPVRAIGRYLQGLHAEAARRGYRFDSGRIVSAGGRQRRIPVTRGQIEFERQHLLKKLQVRDPERARQLARVRAAGLELHPLFYSVEGGIEPWERP